MNSAVKTAVITGGAGSIGRAIALKLSQAGMAVAICDMDQEKAAHVADEIKAGGGEAAAFPVNVLRSEQINQMTRAVLERFGRIDILIYAAGGSARQQNSPLQHQSDEVIDTILGVNLRGALLCSRAVIGPMLEQQAGKMVFIASIVGVHGKAKHAEYAAAKAGVIAMTKTLAMELGPHGVTVNCVSPGLVPRNAPNHNILNTNYLRKIGVPEDIAHLVHFLVSDEADFITGQNYIVDGGRSLGLKGD